MSERFWTAHRRSSMTIDFSFAEVPRMRRPIRHDPAALAEALESKRARPSLGHEDVALLTVCPSDAPMAMLARGGIAHAPRERSAGRTAHALYE